MKGNRGITLTSVIIYVIGMIIVLGIISTLTTFFYKNINSKNTNEDSSQYTRFSSIFLEEINKENNDVLECKTTENEESYIIFLDGNQYTYKNSSKSIYKNKTKICQNVDICVFKYEVKDGTKKIKVEFKAGNTDFTGTGNELVYECNANESNIKTSKTDNLLDKSFYGDFVDYGYDLNGDGNTANDWRLFYQDSKENVFIISAEYLPITQLEDIKNNLGIVTTGTYKVSWNTTWPITNLDNARSEFLYTQMNRMNNSNNNYKMTASLLDTTKWSKFVNNKANFAIGTPTLEMWVNSWNTKYPYDKVFFKANGTTNADGYQVSINGINYSDSLSISGKTGYSDVLESNNMYFPHKTSPETDLNGYWLSAPYTSSDYNMTVNQNGTIGVGNLYSSEQVAIRPVIKLKKKIKMQRNDNSVWQLSISE